MKSYGNTSGTTAIGSFVTWVARWSSCIVAKNIRRGMVTLLSICFGTEVFAVEYLQSNYVVRIAGQDISLSGTDWGTWEWWAAAPSGMDLAGVTLQNDGGQWILQAGTVDNGNYTYVGSSTDPMSPASSFVYDGGNGDTSPFGASFGVSDMSSADGSNGSGSSGGALTGAESLAAYGAFNSSLGLLITWVWSVAGAAAVLWLVFRSFLVMRRAMKFGDREDVIGGYKNFQYARGRGGANNRSFRKHNGGRAVS